MFSLHHMKIILILLTAILSNNCIFSQSDTNIHYVEDTLAPYQKSPYIPKFSLLTPDSTWFSKIQLKDNVATLILYFSPDCGHCKIETQELLGKVNQLKNLQIVMVTSRPIQDMIDFSNYFKIEKFPSIKIGSDPARLITRFYDVKSTPFSALYDKEGRLLTVYKKGIDFPDLINLINF